MTRLANRWYGVQLRELSPLECREALTYRTIGRVALSDPCGPVVLPVTYVVHGDDVLFRTDPDSVIAQRLPDRAVSFQVDEYDDYTESGWSVLLRGTATLETVTAGRMTADWPNPWADGPRTVYVRITPMTMTGRRLLPV